MPFYRIIPSLLLRGGRLVKGDSFADHVDAGSPGTTARAYDAQRADELIVLDIDASREGRPPDLQALGEVAANCMTPIAFGGGIATVEVARSCLALGADKICLNHAARTCPSLISDLANTFGSQAVVLCLDLLRDGDDWAVFDHVSSTCVELSWRQQLAQAAVLGAGEIKLTAVDREGKRCGLDVELWRAARRVVDLPMILEGGAGSLDHLAEAMSGGADSLAIGTMLVFSDNNIIQLKRYLSNAGHSIRL